MYKEHILFTIFIGTAVAIASFFLSLDYRFIAETAINIMGIASAVYLAIYPLLQGSKNLVEMLSTPDSRLPLKTQMGVINTYIKVGLIMGIVSISFGCVEMLLVGSYNEIIEKMPTWYLVISSLFIGQFASNFSILWYVGLFMVRRVAFNR